MLVISRFIILLLFGISTAVFAYGNSGKNDADSTKKSTDKIVTVAFTVDTSGKIEEIKVLKVKCKKCSKEEKENLKQEAIRIISGMKDFPKCEKSIRYKLPMKFNIN